MSSLGNGGDALMVLPPDFTAPRTHLALRFPPLGPAVVAACASELGLRFRAVDLVIELEREPLAHDGAALADAARVERYLAGAPDPSIEAALDELAARVERAGGRAPTVAISVDRGSQLSAAAALSVELKRRWGARIIAGGVSMPSLRALLQRTGARGADVVTTASSPPQIARAFRVLAELPIERLEAPVEPNDELVTLVRGGFRAAPSPEGWPLPDFSIYELAHYRRDPLQAEGAAPADGSPLAPSLALPYFFSFECQFSCAFCQTGGTQEAKPPDRVVRELATLAERWDTTEFVLFDTQINLHAEGLSRALIDARLDLRWSDSLRVRPLSPGLLELMARAGCASLTVGVESASERVLKAMVKGHRPEHASEMVREAHACEMLLRVNILTCFPGETRGDLMQTCDWVREHAFAIDDLAPSSFYLTADSPVGRRPERFGVRLRGPRPLDGEQRFRKSPDSLTYDEIDGYTWEEREATLEESEELVRSAWREGRRALGYAGPLGPTTMLALRRRFATKREICELWAGPREEPRAEPAAAAPALTAALIAPRRGGAALARALSRSFERALPSMAGRLAPGATAYALLFADGSSFFFRGSVVRDARDRPRSITIEEALGPAHGPAAGDERAVALRAGAKLDAAGVAALGRVAVLGFRVEVAP